MSVAATESTPSTFQFGVFEVDLATRELFRAGRKVPLQDQPFQVLAMLIERRGELVSREELQQRLWSTTEYGDFDIGLNKAVAKLREALHDDASAPRYIETLPKRGYRFIWEGQPAADTGESKRDRLKPLLTLLAVIAALVVAGLLLRGKLANQRSVVAVLPFRNLTPNQDYFSDALTIELITTLSRVHPSRLGVIAPTSVMAYRNSTEGVRAIGSQLNANYVVEGTVQRSERWVRINARLTRVDDQTQVWAEMFDREDGDLFKIQSDVANAIARAVRVSLAPPQETRPTQNAEAYEEYLKGVSLEQTHARAVDAVGHFERAVQLDPGFARAWVGIGECSFFTRPRPESMARAEAAIRRAIELDPDLPNAHAALGTLQMIWHWNWDAADAEFRLAMAKEPVEPSTLVRYAQYLAARGRLDEAIATQRRAAELDPRSPLVLQQLGRLYYFKGRPQDALVQWKKSLDIDPRFWWSNLFMSFVYRDMGDYKGWFDQQKRVFELSGVPLPIIEEFEHTAQLKGYEETLRTMVHYQEAAAAKTGPDSMTLAIEHAKFGDRDAAIRWLEALLPVRSNDIIYVNVEPAFAPFRSDPRFQAIVKKVFADR
jgi:TolB-like protein/DNA-binding winged helix-turn-helix (wHTH) protein